MAADNPARSGGLLGLLVPWPGGDSAVVQVVVVGWCCFFTSGLYNVIYSISGGISDLVLSDMATALLYFVFAVASFAAPAVCNLLGPRHTLALGSLGYAAYVLGLYVYSTDGSSVLSTVCVLAGAMLCGLSAALLWTAQGQLVLALPLPEERARCFSLFWIIFSFGGIIGGVVDFGMNYDAGSSSSAASPATFLVFGTFMLLGGVLAMVGLTPPERVRRRGGGACGGGAKDDGGGTTKRGVELRPLPSVREEAAATVALLGTRPVRLLLPLFLYSNWFYSYQVGWRESV